MRNWKEFDIYIIDNKLSDLGLDSKSDGKITIDLNCVCSFNETYYTDGGETGTSVELDSGDSSVIKMKYEEF